MELSGLNTQQRRAVEHRDGPLLLLAGAGSGKTRVITFRIAHLIQRCGVSSAQIMAVTFTNKAAREMKERVAQLVGRDTSKGMVISTFHSMCVRILREDIDRLGYKKNFSIYGTADQTRLIKDLMQDVNLDGKKFDADRIIWMISDAKNRLVGPEAFEIRYEDPCEHMAAAIYPRYQKSLKAFNAVDFDDLIMLTVRLLKEHPDILEKYQKRFAYIMVDEYQDTNAAQYLLLRLLAGGHRNLCVVGDDDQSIYGWRGADLGNILDFERDFAGTTVIKLEQNYRSSGNILAAANAVIRNNTQRKEKALWTDGAAGLPIDYILCESEEDEAKVVVDRIQAACYQTKRSFSEFAVLFRTNAQSRVFEEQFRYQGIPYVLIGGQQFFDRKEVKDALSYLRVLVNTSDEVNLLRILNYPRRGIGTTTADHLIRYSGDKGVPLWDVLQKPERVAVLGEKPLAAIRSFVETVKSYRKKFQRNARLAETCRAFFTEIKLETEILRTTEDLGKARRRVENLYEVINAMASYEEREEEGSLTGFLEKVSLLDEVQPGADGKEKKLASESVVLMSLHSSKGLEFPEVFMVGVEEEFLPHKKTIEEGSDVAEERRLCYVGITRAQHCLTLLGCRQRKKFGQLQERCPSRFLDEIPQDLLRTQESGLKEPLTEEEQDSMASGFFSQMKNLLGDGK